jgi:hypothetical protein
MNIVARRRTMSDLMLDVGQANELKLAFRRADFSNDDIKRLCEGKVLTEIRSVLRGHASITVIEHVIDCDADPFVPDDWTVEEHRKGGIFKWNAADVALYLDKDQKNGKVLEGNKLRKVLVGKPVFNANVLDYLLAHPHLIPEEWKGKFVFFWGTIYRSRFGNLFVRDLAWDDGRWCWGFGWLDDVWSDDDPAAVPAS